MSKDLKWLIFRSLEDEWRWGTTAMDKHHFNPGEKLTIVETGVHTMPEMKKMLKEFVLKYGIDYDDQAFNLQNELLIQSNADELLVVYKGNDVWVEILLNKKDCKWKVVSR